MSRESAMNKARITACTDQCRTILDAADVRVLAAACDSWNKRLKGDERTFHLAKEEVSVFVVALEIYLLRRIEEEGY